jgi:hypothetical protein
MSNCVVGLRRLRASSRDGSGVVNRPPPPLNMLLSRHTRRREFVTLLCKRYDALVTERSSPARESVSLPPISTPIRWTAVARLDQRDAVDHFGDRV